MPNELPLRPRRLLTEGDSWLALTGGSPETPNDLEEMLEGRHPYKIVSLASKGDTMEKIASREQLGKLTEEVEALRAQERLIDAVLLSGGGNDLRKQLPLMLREFNPAAPEGWLDSSKVDEFVGTLRERYLTVLGCIDNAFVSWRLASRMPVLLHGYAYPVPDGTGRGDVAEKWGFAGPWLQPTFETKGYCSGDEIECLQRNTEIVANIIDGLNEMLGGLMKTAWDEIVVQYVDFRPSLVQRSSLRDYVADREEGYKAHWTDELHLSSTGLSLVVPVLVSALNNALDASTES